MYDPLWQIFELSINAFQGFVFSYFIFGILKLKPRFKHRSIPFLINALLIFITITFFNSITYFEGVAAFIYSLIVFIIAVLFLQGSILKKLLFSIIPITCMAIGSIFSTNTSSLLFDKSVVELMSESSVYRLFTVIVSNTVMFLIMYVIKRLATKNTIALKKSEWILMTAVLSLSVIIFMLLYFSIFSGISESGKTFIALSILGIIAIDFTVYFLLLQLSRKHAISTENELLKQQYSLQTKSINEIKNQYEQLQKARHDFNNNLNVIRILNHDKKHDQIEKFISKYLNEQEKSLKFVSTNNDYLNAIINSKLSAAYNENIKVKLNISPEINCINELDLCKLIGNIFDNAIEASSKLDAEKNIYFELSSNKNETDVFIKNSIQKSVLESNPNLETDKADPAHHGYGTKIIKDIALKYHGFADFYEDEGYFCCNVVLYNIS